jgi:hypothetical protein
MIAFDINIWYISFLLGKFDFQNPRGRGADNGLVPSPCHQPYTIISLLIFEALLPVNHASER